MTWVVAILSFVAGEIMGTLTMCLMIASKNNGKEE